MHVNRNKLDYGLMIKSDTILLDVDDVLLDWFEGFSRYMAHQGHTYSGERSWEMDDNYNLSKPLMREHIVRFNSGHWEFGTLQPLSGAKEGVIELKNHGYNLVAITACSTNPVAVALRKANLYWCFGDVFKAVHCVDLAEAKDTHLADYEPTYWVEDKMTNAIAGLKYGHKSILLEAPYNVNQNHPEVTKVKTWQDVLGIILKDIDVVD